MSGRWPEIHCKGIRINTKFAELSTQCCPDCKTNHVERHNSPEPMEIEEEPVDSAIGCRYFF